MSLPRQKLFLALANPGALTLEGLKANPIVPGVSMIAEGPAKGHSYFDEANQQIVPVFIDGATLQSVMTCAQTYDGGLRVNAGHFTGILEACGFLNSFALDGTKLRAALNLFRSFSQFEHLCELIVKIPDTFGLSIDFEGNAEVIDGKAFPRCTTIYSCDLVPTPAANEGGLFSANLTPELMAHLRRLFDNAAPANPNAMPDNPPATPPPTPPATSPAAPPATPPPSLTKADLDAALSAKLDPFVSELTTLKTEFSVVVQRLGTVEAALAAAPGADNVEPAAAPAPMQALRKELAAIKVQLGEQTQKLARRFGLEFAARAGANPVENPAGAGEGDGTDTRKPFEIPSADRNAAALKALGIGKS